MLGWIEVTGPKEWLKKKFKYYNFLAKQIFTILMHPDPYQNVKDPEHWGGGHTGLWEKGQGCQNLEFGRGDRHSCIN